MVSLWLSRFWLFILFLCSNLIAVSNAFVRENESAPALSPLRLFSSSVISKPSGNKRRCSTVAAASWLHLTASKIQYVIWIWKPYFFLSLFRRFALAGCNRIEFDLVVFLWRPLCWAQFKMNINLNCRARFACFVRSILVLSVSRLSRRRRRKKWIIFQQNGNCN